jgi:hypothetical protein
MKGKKKERFRCSDITFSFVYYLCSRAILRLLFSS